jgi:transcriptional regulator with XRE-family HTH domain
MTGDDLRDYRARLNLTPSQLAKTAGITVRAVRSIESGQSPTNAQRERLLLVGVREDSETLHGNI